MTLRWSVVINAAAAFAFAVRVFEHLHHLISSSYNLSFN